MILHAVHDRKKWLDLISDLPIQNQDIYYHPDYLKLNCYKKNSDAYLFYNIENNKIWINPFIKIKIPSYLLSENKNYYDLETAYGYGGPISNTDDKIFIKKSNELFVDWSHNSSIVSEFVRFHPIINNITYVDDSVKIMENRITCSLDLKKINKNLDPFKSKVKNMIRRAETELDCYISKKLEDFLEFKKIYLNLMINKNAEQEVFFSNSYFKKLYNLVKESGFMSIISNKQKKIISIGLFLIGKKSCHYHLSASISNNYKGVGNYLIYNAAIYSREIGIETMHLGGGNLNSKEDNLFKFKNSMSTNNHIYFIGKRIYLPKVYSQLKINWKNKYPILFKKYSSRLLCYHLNAEIINT